MKIERFMYVGRCVVTSDGLFPLVIFTQDEHFCPHIFVTAIYSFISGLEFCRHVALRGPFFSSQGRIQRVNSGSFLRNFFFAYGGITFLFLASDLMGKVKECVSRFKLKSNKLARISAKTGRNNFNWCFQKYVILFLLKIFPPSL